jgi:hypothetical protein
MQVTTQCIKHVERKAVGWTGHVERASNKRPGKTDWVVVLAGWCQECKEKMMDSKSPERPMHASPRGFYGPWHSDMGLVERSPWTLRSGKPPGLAFVSKVLGAQKMIGG